MSEWPGFRATLLRGLPAIKHLRIQQRVLSLQNEMSRQPLDRVPSVPRDLGVISDQHPHHGITQIDIPGLFAIRLHEMRNPVQLRHHCIQCIYASVSYCYHPFLNCQLESVCSRTMLHHNVCQSGFHIFIISLRTRSPIRGQVPPV